MARLPVRKSRNACGSFRPTKTPNLLAGPGGKGVAEGVGVGSSEVEGRSGSGDGVGVSAGAVFWVCCWCEKIGSSVEASEDGGASGVSRAPTAVGVNAARNVVVGVGAAEILRLRPNANADAASSAKSPPTIKTHPQVENRRLNDMRRS